jgi:hypothetical protein
MIEIQICDQSQRDGSEQELSAIHNSPLQKHSVRLLSGVSTVNFFYHDLRGRYRCFRQPTSGAFMREG